jgi:hypothetical protein
MPVKSENQEAAAVSGPLSVLTPREQMIMLQSVLTIKGFPAVSLILPNHRVKQWRSFQPFLPIAPSPISSPVLVPTSFAQ